MSKNIVITGATSFIGTHLVHTLLAQGNVVWAVIRPNSPHRYRLPHSKPCCHIVECDITQFGRLASIVPAPIDCFYHLAWAGVRVPQRDDEKMQKQNYLACLTAFQAAVKLKVKVFIGTGSQAEYGHVNGIIKEDQQAKPISAYGRYKLKAGQALLQEASKAGILCIWTRIFSVYGPYDDERSLIMSLIKACARHAPVKLTQGEQLWDYLYVQDAAQALAAFLQKRVPSGIYHIANGNPRPLKEFILAVKAVLHSQSPLLFGAIPYGKEGRIDLMPDVTKIKKTIGWEATTPFALGIKQTWECERIK